MSTARSSGRRVSVVVALIVGVLVAILLAAGVLLLDRAWRDDGGGIVLTHLRPSADGLTEPVAGTVRRYGDCLFLEEGTARRVVVWPHSTTWATEPDRLVLPDGREVPVGAQVAGAGASYSSPDLLTVVPTLNADIAGRARSCAGAGNAEVLVFNADEPVTVG